MKIAAFKLKVDSDKTRIGLVDIQKQTIQEYALHENVSEEGVLKILKLQLADTPLPKIIAIHALNEIQLLAPIPRPRRNIFCVGKNYFEHAKEFGTSGYDSTKADALKLVWAYTSINDVTARDWQQRHKQWFLGKSFDTFCPMGPWIVTRDELKDDDISVKCWVNDELRQSSNSKDLIFDVPTLIETISAGITLYPGDIIATGTPAGVGLGFKPPKFLVAGDTVRMEVGGVGVLENKLVNGA